MVAIVDIALARPLTAVDGANCYLRQVASGVEDHYTGRGEAVGYWTGSAAVELGLEGVLDADDLRAVLGGRDPREPDEPLGSWKSGRKVLAFDVVLRAPKPGCTGEGLVSVLLEGHGERVVRDDSVRVPAGGVAALR